MRLYLYQFYDDKAVIAIVALDEEEAKVKLRAHMMSMIESNYPGSFNSDKERDEAIEYDLENSPLWLNIDIGELMSSNIGKMIELN